MTKAPYLKWLHEVQLSDIPTVGGKNASLGEMIQNLGKLGVQVPGGFVVTVASYEAFIAHNVLDQKIRDIVAKLDVDDVENIRRTGLAVRTLVKNGKFPEEVWKGILQRYDEMSQQYVRKRPMWPCVLRLRQRIFRMLRSLDNRRPSSTSVATRT